KSQQLSGNLLEILANENVVVNQGRLIVEVSSNQISKGTAVRHFMEKKDYDRVICVGDDKTDEAMFKIDDPRIISIKIGPEDTFAKYRLSSPTLLRDFLAQLIKRKKRHHDG
ncbi:MAG TPA: trehalose-phosphatase, partial [Candidatus Omnitrophota bacterium]|nr:trehalose-phosphatase [Candidatus Omnitrophota bacterium]